MNKVDSAYGQWNVSTEGNEEGSSIRHLGAYEGYFDEIAFALADKCYYALYFSPILPLKIVPSDVTASSVVVSLEGASGNIAVFKSLLKNRKVTVKAGGGYEAVTLINGDSPEEIARRKNEAIRNKALAKLTSEERKALGFNETA